jgi:hypothetical protein
MNSLPVSRYSSIKNKVGDNWGIHVRVLIPRHRIKINSSALVVDTARAQFLKQPNHARTSRLICFLSIAKSNVEQYPLTPPLNHVMSGALSGFLRAAKNQNLFGRSQIKTGGTLKRAQTICSYSQIYHHIRKLDRPPAWFLPKM